MGDLEGAKEDVDDVGEEGNEGGRDWMASSTFLQTTMRTEVKSVQDCLPLKFLLGDI